MSEPLFAPFTPANLADPLPMYRALRAEGRVLWHEQLQSWLCPSYAECHLVAKDAARFASDPRRAGEQIPDVMRSIQTLDPPEHGALRHALTVLFRSQDLARFERRVVDELSTRLGKATADGAEIDLVRDVADPLALDTITGFLGLNPIDHEVFAQVSERLVRGMDFGFLPDALEPSMRAREEISALVDEQLSGLRDDEGFAARLLRETPSIDRPIVVNSIRVLLHAGYSSVSRLLENAMLALVADRDLQRRFAALTGDEAIANAVQELIRHDGPVQAEARLVAEDTELAGTGLSRGDCVILLFGSANHDDEVFDEPGTIDLARTPNPHLAFGRGPHSCLGAGISLLQARLVLPRIFADPDQPVVPTADPARRENASLRGVSTLPVRMPLLSDAA